MSKSIYNSNPYYAAVLERAKRTVEQWDKHDQYRQTEADKLLNDPQIGEPDDVAIARTVLRLNDVMKLERLGSFWAWEKDMERFTNNAEESPYRELDQID